MSEAVRVTGWIVLIMIRWMNPYVGYRVDKVVRKRVDKVVRKRVDKVVRKRVDEVVPPFMLRQKNYAEKHNHVVVNVGGIYI